MGDKDRVYHSVEEYRKDNPGRDEKWYEFVENTIRTYGEMITITVPMLYTKEDNAFVRKIEWGHRLAAKSRLVFKGNLETSVQPA